MPFVSVLLFGLPFGKSAPVNLMTCESAPDVTVQVTCVFVWTLSVSGVKPLSVMLIESK